MGYVSVLIIVTVYFVFINDVFGFELIIESVCATRTAIFITVVVIRLHGCASLPLSL